MFDRLKHKYGIYKLQKDFLNIQRITQITNLSDAKSLGIIYNASEVGSFEKIKSFVHELRHDIPEVVALGYVNQKELSDNHIKPQGFIFFCKKDTNWYNYPIEYNLLDFIYKNFDILIDFDFYNTLAIKFAVVLSKAKFRVGKFDYQQYNYYDLTLNIDDEHDDSLTYFIEQLKIYLRMIKIK